MDTTSDSFGAPIAFGVQAETITALEQQVAELTSQRDHARGRLAEVVTEARRTQEAFQEALDEQEDRDLAESVVEFLSANRMGWSFTTTRTYRVELTVWVTVEADDEDAAVEAAEQAVTVDHSDGVELESVENASVEVATR